MAGSVYSLVALGFALIYNTVRFFHFAHGAVYTTGAFLTYTFFVLLKLPLLFSVVLAVLLAALLGVGMELFVYKPLRKRGASNLVFLIASLGLFILLQNSISTVFGDDTKTIRSGIIQEGHKLFGVYITDIQLVIILASLALFVITTSIIKFSKIGKALRAVANDQDLATAVGIDTQKVIYFTFFIGSALAAVAAILISLDLDMTPMMGFNMMLYAVVAVIIGGVGNFSGAYLGGLLLGIVQHIGVWYISSRWQETIVFVILIIFLLFRPQGFFGKNLPNRKG